jgi:hypothetical protein
MRVGIFLIFCFLKKNTARAPGKQIDVFIVLELVCCKGVIACATKYLSPSGDCSPSARFGVGVFQPPRSDIVKVFAAKHYQVNKRSLNRILQPGPE